MATELENTKDAEVPEPIFLTEKESKEMREEYAQRHFGMSVAEFYKAWEAGEFRDDRERHSKVVTLAMMIPEAWKSDAW